MGYDVGYIPYIPNSEAVVDKNTLIWLNLPHFVY